MRAAPRPPVPPAAFLQALYRLKDFTWVPMDFVGDIEGYAYLNRFGA